MKIFYLILLVITFILTTNAQTKTTESISWKGMSVDVSSPTDVITKFGKPEKDETDRLDVLVTKGNLFTQNTNKKEWRVLKYKEIDQVTNVRFGFNKNDKLIFIKFNPPIRDRKKFIDVQAFIKSFEEISFKPQEYNSTEYILVGKQEYGYILAKIGRGALALFGSKSIFDTKTIEDVSNDNLDGVVITVQFVSKSLENNDNTDILK